MSRYTSSHSRVNVTIDGISYEVEARSNDFDCDGMMESFDIDGISRLDKEPMTVPEVDALVEFIINGEGPEAAAVRETIEQELYKNAYDDVPEAYEGWE
jgi:hypothetical protein